jgi:hypothetical protein
MTPVNNKSVLAFLFNQMEKLDNKEITVDEAKAVSELAKQVNNAMKYELDRANTKMKLRVHNFEYKDNIELRDVESKNFD